MDIYLTQNSYFFVHRHFLRHFERNNSEILYITENGRGLGKKYLEIIANLGAWNFLICGILEVLFFIKLARRQANLKSIAVTDLELNTRLEGMLKTGNYDRVISIGAPCLIDATLQKNLGVEILNLHGGILPVQKGRFSPIKSILKGHKHLGATLYRIADVFDEGTILSQNSFKMRNKRKLENYILVLDAAAVLLDDFFEGKVTAPSQEVLASLQSGAS